MNASSILHFTMIVDENVVFLGIIVQSIDELLYALNAVTKSISKELLILKVIVLGETQKCTL